VQRLLPGKLLLSTRTTFAWVVGLLYNILQ
jgi:hypothetical protein